jgi:hypothetical protein
MSALQFQLSDTMENFSSCFSKLPEDFRLCFLREVVAQMDQEDLYGVIPSVSRELRKMALDVSHDIDVELSTWESAERFGLWLERHGTRLRSLTVDVRCGIVVPINEDEYDFDQDPPLQPEDFTAPLEHRTLLNSISTATQLRSLHLIGFDMYDLSEQLPRLTNLTSLCLDSCHLVFDTVKALMGLTQLQHFRLPIPDYTALDFELPEAIASSMKQLTYLSLPGYNLTKDEIAALRPPSCHTCVN